MYKNSKKNRGLMLRQHHTSLFVFFDKDRVWLPDHHHAHSNHNRHNQRR